MRRSRRFFFALACAGLAAGCISVLPEAGPAPDVYRLAAGGGTATIAAVGADARDVAEGPIITVPTPLAARALNTDRLAVVTDGNMISYAAGARWDETAPHVIQEAVITRLEADPRFGAGVRPEDSVVGDYELRLDVRRFEAVYEDGADAAPTIHVVARMRLVRREARALLGADEIAVAVPASQNRVSAIVAAFETALDRVTAQAADWTHGTAARDPAERAAEADAPPS